MEHHRRIRNESFSRLSLETPTSSQDLVQKPHRLSDSAFSTVPRDQALNFRDFRLLNRIGAGDIGKVYLCKLRSDESCSYAMKVVDKEVLAAKKKTHRAEMETKILKMLDHPFLPSLYAHFEASHFSCIVMEYCSGGDLHSLRDKQPQNRFSLHSARFYAAEVLVALEYLHMLGIIYRDLKPENVLVRSDGHIMLSDFDLSLIADSVAAVEFQEASPLSAPNSPRAAPPFSCLPFRSRKVQTITSHQVFVAEPTGARSCSFVGTHEYVAPEVASGKSHGNAVDWWAFGIFLYEMMYGRTPFAGANNIATLRNIVGKALKFPSSSGGSSRLSEGEREARDLISCLLAKDPTSRLGSIKGAAEVKTHPFFRGMNFALIRSSTPPPSAGKQSAVMPFKSRKASTNGTAFDCF